MTNEMWVLIMTTLSWFAMVWFVSTGISLIVLQLLLPLAWSQIRANPPKGAGWAHALWYERQRIYTIVLFACVLLGLLAAGVYLLG
jgi:hypothetical protein